MSNFSASFTNPWTISHSEHQQNQGQFFVLRPDINGLITGEQAKPFFLKSGLPPSLLAQVWQLADVTKDGKLDLLEFSIAVKLIRNKLSGLELPKELPDTMKQISQPLIISNNVPITRPLSVSESMMMMGSSSNLSMRRESETYSSNLSETGRFDQTKTLPTARERMDWSLPQNLKLRFSQQFNQLDKKRIGLLTGDELRGLFSESQIPFGLLAQIWSMSDVNKDGCLSIEEFCVAMYLIEMVKTGYALPSKLPAELGTFCHRSKTASPGMTDSNETLPPQKVQLTKSFEDKRKDNFDRGQQELERRREQLRMEEEIRRTEIERREREEEERRERERLELELRRDEEKRMERQREMMRERERAQAEERLKTERHETRLRLENQRRLELEKARLEQLSSNLTTEKEKTSEMEQREKNMQHELQELEQRACGLNETITSARNELFGITSEIEQMRELRDQKLLKISEINENIKALSLNCEKSSHTELQLQTKCQQTSLHSNEATNLTKQLATLEADIHSTRKEFEATTRKNEIQEKVETERRAEFESCNQKLSQLAQEYKSLHQQFKQKVSTVAKTSEGDKQNNNNVGIIKSEEFQFKPQLYDIPPSTEESPWSVTPAVSNNYDPFGMPQTFDQEPFHEPFANTNINNGFENNFADFGSAFGNEAQADATKTGMNTTAVSDLLNAHRGSLREHTTTNGISLIEQAEKNERKSKIVKYRALYEFTARSEDELTIKPGDVVIIFEGHESEPGWLAAQSKNKVGWVPASFVEPIDSAISAPGLSKQGTLTSSTSGEPLESIKEEELLDKKERKPSHSKLPEIERRVETKNGPATNTSLYYDTPPIIDDIEKPKTGTEISDTQTNIDGSKQLLDSAANGATDANINIGIGTALYTWKARNSSEISFTRGDEIEIFEQREMLWKGRLKKNPTIQGWFPKSYVSKELRIEKKQVLPTDSKINSPTSKSSIAITRGNSLTKITQENFISEVRKSKTTDSFSPLSTAKKSNEETAPTNPTHQKELNGNANGQQKNEERADEGKESDGSWYIALYNFEPVEDDDLPLQVGSRIFVKNSDATNEEWWRGTWNGKSGIFPSNYVQKIVNKTTPDEQDSTSPIVIMLGKAIATFDASAPNQVSLHTGDIVRVHNTSPAGWWEGEVEHLCDLERGAKKFGWFPGNYIEVSQTNRQSLTGASTEAKDDVKKLPLYDATPY